MSASTAPSLAAPGEELGLRPSVLRAWAGLWLLTWKSRLTWRTVPGLLATVLAIPVLTFFTLDPMEQDHSSTHPFYRWLVDFYFLLVLPLYCLTSCGSVIRDEVQSDTLCFLTTRPLSRARLFLLKYCCQLMWLEALVAVQALAMYLAGFARGAPDAASTMGWFFGAQFLAVLAWGALSVLLGLITRRYLLLGLAYGFVVEIGIGHIPTNINSISLTRHLQALLGQHVLLGESIPQSAWLSVGVILLAVAIFLGAGAVLFTLREFHHAVEMQK